MSRFDITERVALKEYQRAVKAANMRKVPGPIYKNVDKPRKHIIYSVPKEPRKSNLPILKKDGVSPTSYDV